MYNIVLYYCTCRCENGNGIRIRRLNVGTKYLQCTRIMVYVQTKLKRLYWWVSGGGGEKIRNSWRSYSVSLCIVRERLFGLPTGRVLYTRGDATFVRYLLYNIIISIAIYMRVCVRVCESRRCPELVVWRYHYYYGVGGKFQQTEKKASDEAAARMRYTRLCIAYYPCMHRGAYDVIITTV